MSNLNESHIDNLFRNELGNTSVQPPAHLWTNIASQVGANPSVVQSTVVKTTVNSMKLAAWITTAVVSIVAGVAVYHFNSEESNIPQKANKEKNALNVTENSVADQQITSPKIEKTEEKKVAKPAPPLPDFSKSAFFGDISRDYDESPASTITSSDYRTMNTEIRGENNPIKEKEASPIFANTAKNNSIKCRAYYEKTITQPAENSVDIGINGLKGEYSIDFGNGKQSKYTGESHTFKCEYYVRSAQYFNVKIGANFAGVCADSQTVKIFVRPIQDENQSLIPTVFTPNGDGKNDSFFVRIVRPEKFDLVVMDLRGAIVFKTNDLNQKWDGKYQGVMCKEGVYSAIIRSQYSGEKKENIQRVKVNLMYNNND